MTVADARVELLRYPFPTPVGGSGITSVDVIIVDLREAQGAAGLGLSFALGGGGELPALAARQLLERFVVGKPFAHPLAQWRAIAATFNRTGRGPWHAALAALDVAAWDLYAKALAVPLGLAMGGAARRVPVYGSGSFRPDQAPADAAAIARAYVARGARGVKPRVAGTAADEPLLRAVAEALPAGVALMCDANERCTPLAARRLLQFAASAGAAFVEEPLPATSLRGYRELARNAPVALATGEHLQGCVEAGPFLFDGLCGVIQPDLQMMGGLSECLRVAQLAEQCNVEVAPHFLPGLFIHLAAAAPGVTWLEDFPLFEPLFDGMPAMEADGCIGLPAAPGHGLTLAGGARETFRVDYTAT
jgi:L-alanine-DL-glutamate epimerase-like enolase superfamily enzyme